MYKSIFLPVSSHGDQHAALAFAAALAQGLDGEAEAVFASKSLTLLDAAQRHDVGDVLIKQGYGASQDLLDELYLKQYHEREKSVAAWFEGKRAGLRDSGRLVWRESLELFGESAEQIRDECLFHDITVASFDLGTTVFDDVVTGALFSTARPLVLIRAFEPGRKLSDLTITLAFKPSPPMLRAQWDALPLLKLAKRVLLVGVEEGDSNYDASLVRFSKYLGGHGVSCEHFNLTDPGDPAAKLEAFHFAQKSDLLVMGAYSHSRLTQLVFGGFTRHFLSRANCNLFLAH